MFLAGGSSGGSGGSGSKDDVIELTESNFKKLVLQSDDMWLVEFFAPWCGHCKVKLTLKRHVYKSKQGILIKGMKDQYG